MKHINKRRTIDPMETHTDDTPSQVYHRAYSELRYDYDKPELNNHFEYTSKIWNNTPKIAAYISYIDNFYIISPMIELRLLTLANKSIYVPRNYSKLWYKGLLMYCYERFTNFVPYEDR